MESFWVVLFLLMQSKLPLAAGGEQTGQAGEEMTHSKAVSSTLCRIRELGTKPTYSGSQHSPCSKQTFIRNQSRWSAEILPRKGQVNTDASVLTLPSNGSSINTKYLFRCYCATSVASALLIALSLPRGFKARREEGEARRCRLRRARSDLGQHPSPLSSPWWAKLCPTELEFAPSRS